MKAAVICASNMNRSMETHHVLSKKGINIRSFGTNSMVKIPGPSLDRPNVYAFGTPYDVIYNDLKGKDSHLYTQNGLLHMLERNKGIKTSPDRFQESTEKFDVIFTCEERCFEIVCEEYSSKSSIISSGVPEGFAPPTQKVVYVVNFEIRDTHEDATVGARAILQMALLLQSIFDKQKAGIEAESIDSVIFSCQEKFPDANIYYVNCLLADEEISIDNHFNASQSGRFIISIPGVIIITAAEWLGSDTFENNKA